MENIVMSVAHFCSFDYFFPHVLEHQSKIQKPQITDDLINNGEIKLLISEECGAENYYHGKAENAVVIRL